MEQLKESFQSTKIFSKIIFVLVAIIVLVGLYWTSFYNFLLFHSLVEIFSIIIAVGVFIVAWNTRKFSSNYFLLFLGISALFIGSIDLIHALAYKGIGIFPQYDANLPTQLWIAGRYLHAISFLIATIFISHKFKVGAVFMTYLLVIIGLFLSIFYFNIFPDCFIEGEGLTAFKKISEYIISAIFLVFIIILYLKRNILDKKILIWLVIAGITSIISEIAFTFYVSVFGLSNVVGHIFKIVAFFALYVAMVQTTLLKPYAVLFKDLKDSSEKMKKINHELNIEVKKRQKTEVKLRKILKD